MKWVLILLVCAVFVSALQVVVVRHKNRMLFAELQKLQQQRDALNVSFGQLQLEQSTLAELSRVETIAREQLDMVMPTPDDIVVIRP
jgi:cell division protein FtsL